MVILMPPAMLSLLAAPLVVATAGVGENSDFTAGLSESSVEEEEAPKAV